MRPRRRLFQSRLRGLELVQLGRRLVRASPTERRSSVLARCITNRWNSNNGCYTPAGAQDVMSVIQWIVSILLGPLALSASSRMSDSGLEHRSSA